MKQHSTMLSVKHLFVNNMTECELRLFKIMIMRQCLCLSVYFIVRSVSGTICVSVCVFDNQHNRNSFRDNKTQIEETMNESLIVI